MANGYRGITGSRLAITKVLRSKTYDICMIVLIIFYTVFVFVQFGIDEQDFYEDIETNIFITELVVLGIFVLEIISHIYGYGILYLKDIWNILDIIIILISIAFVLMDLLIQTNSALNGFLKIRGIFRLLRVFILIRKLNVVRMRRDVRKKKFSNDIGYDIRSPVEKVLEIINEVRESLDPRENARIIQDLNYCLKMISSSKLYEADLDLEE